VLLDETGTAKIDQNAFFSSVKDDILVLHITVDCISCQRLALKTEGFFELTDTMRMQET
jgi:hypothetical protein